MVDRGEEIFGSRKRASNTFLHVVAGGGKSRCVPLLYHHAKLRGGVIWVAPRRSLQQQAADAAAEGIDGAGTGGLRLAPDLHSYSKDQHQGFVTTYSMLALHLGDHQKILGEMGAGSLLAADEVHHCSYRVDSDRQPGWTESLRGLDLRLGHHTLLMSGTPYRGDGRPIYLGTNETTHCYQKAGAAADDWQLALPDGKVYVYGRNKARKERAVLPIQPMWLDGELSFTLKQGEHEIDYHFSSFDEISRSVYSPTLKERMHRKALKAFVSYNSVETVHKPAIRHALFHLRETKQRFPGAQMIVTVDRQGTANTLRNWMESMGIRTALAVSDYGQSLDELNDFRAGKYEAMITVGMAYEGLDAPKVTHLVHLGRFRDPSWLTQYFARAWRWGPSDWPADGRLAYIFMPKDGPMLGAYQAIIDEFRMPVYLESPKASGFGKPGEDVPHGRLTTCTPGEIA